MTSSASSSNLPTNNILSQDADIPVGPRDRSVRLTLPRGLDSTQFRARLQGRTDLATSVKSQQWVLNAFRSYEQRVQEDLECAMVTIQLVRLETGMMPPRDMGEEEGDGMRDSSPQSTIPNCGGGTALTRLMTFQPMINGCTVTNFRPYQEAYRAGKEDFLLEFLADNICKLELIRNVRRRSQQQWEKSWLAAVRESERSHLSRTLAIIAETRNAIACNDLLETLPDAKSNFSGTFKHGLLVRNKTFENMRQKELADIQETLQLKYMDRRVSERILLKCQAVVERLPLSLPVEYVFQEGNVRPGILAVGGNRLVAHWANTPPSTSELAGAPHRLIDLVLFKKRKRFAGFIMPELPEYECEEWMERLSRGEQRYQEGLTGVGGPMENVRVDVFEDDGEWRKDDWVRRKHIQEKAAISDTRPKGSRFGAIGDGRPRPSH